MAIILIRTLIMYLSLILVLRLLGKRQLGEMELSEFVVAALIADLAAQPLEHTETPMLNALVPIVTLSCCEVLISGLSMKHIRLRSVIFGQPSVLIERGRIVQRELRKNRFTLDELMQELRAQGLTDISKVETAILETDGRMSVVLYPSEQPATASLLGMQTPAASYPHIIVNDGRIMDDELRRLGLDRKWLQARLHEHGVKAADSVFLMTVNGAGEIYLTEKEAPHET